MMMLSERLPMPRVAPFTGARIEMVYASMVHCQTYVAPFTGARIEISGPMAAGSAVSCRSLHGSVD